VAILPVKGADLVGPLPAELKNVIIYAAGLSAGGQNRAAAQNFIAFLRSDEIGRLIRAKGMEPG
jgi:molybdate transport system substrate-binding protein